MSKKPTVTFSLVLPSLIGLILFSTGCRKDETIITEPQNTNPPGGVSVVSLANATPYTSTVLPGNYSFNQQTDYWSVVGVRPPSTADYDLVLYNDSLRTDSLASSELDGVDFIVADQNHSRKGLYYVQARRFDGTGAYTIEWESGNEQLIIPGVTGPVNWGSATVVKVWDVALTGGTTYTFTVNIVSGTADVGIALFRSNGSPYYAGESSSVISADVNGDGQGETFSYTATSTDFYGFVVWGYNAASASFTITTSR